MRRRSPRPPVGAGAGIAVLLIPAEPVSVGPVRGITPWGRTGDAAGDALTAYLPVCSPCLDGIA